MSEHNISRRMFVVAGLGGLGSIAGCAEPGDSDPLSPAEQTEKEIEHDCKVDQLLRLGESVGVRWSDEQWHVEITHIFSDETIDIRVTKTLLDGAGQDREHIDAEQMFDRVRVEPGDIEKIEGDMWVWYVESNGEEARLAIGQQWCGDE